MNSITKTVNTNAHIVSVTLTGAVDFKALSPAACKGLFDLAQEIVDFNLSHQDANSVLQSGTFNMTRDCGRVQVAWGLESVDYKPLIEGTLQTDAMTCSADGWALNPVDEEVIDSDDDYAESLIGTGYQATASYHYDAESTADYRDSFSISVAV